MPPGEHNVCPSPCLPFFCLFCPLLYDRLTSSEAGPPPPPRRWLGGAEADSLLCVPPNCTPKTPHKHVSMQTHAELVYSLPTFIDSNPAQNPAQMEHYVTPSKMCVTWCVKMAGLVNFLSQRGPFAWGYGSIQPAPFSCLSCLVCCPTQLQLGCGRGAKEIFCQADCTEEIDARRIFF